MSQTRTEKALRYLRPQLPAHVGEGEEPEEEIIDVQAREVLHLKYIGGLIVYIGVPVVFIKIVFVLLSIITTPTAARGAVLDWFTK